MADFRSGFYTFLVSSSIPPSPLFCKVTTLGMIFSDLQSEWRKRRQFKNVSEGVKLPLATPLVFLRLALTDVCSWQILVYYTSIPEPILSTLGNNFKQATQLLNLTVLLGLYVAALQGFEYWESSFSISDPAYGSSLCSNRFLWCSYHYYDVYRAITEAPPWSWHFEDE